MLLSRSITETLKSALTRSPITLLIGARQTGKTTLVKQIAQSGHYSYITFDDLTALAAAQSDPQGFIRALQKPAILDEVQRVPEIFLPLKKMVDEHREPGQFLLTGSANPLLIPRLGDTLVGRIELVKLYPLSQGELIGVREHFIDLLFAREFVVPHSPEISKEELGSRLLTGGYPLVQGVNLEDRNAWFNGYITTMLYREVKDLTNISGLIELPKLLRLLALRTSNLLNVAELSRTLGMPTSTLHRYLALLQTLFLFDPLMPWSSHRGKRLVKAPKISLIDSGLVTYLLGIDLNALLLGSTTVNIGSIVENFVLNELEKQMTWNTTRCTAYHMRNQAGMEVDIILERADGRVVGIEVKASATVTARDFKGLKQLQELLGQQFIRGVVLYSGPSVIPFGDRLFAVPISALWATTQ